MESRNFGKIVLSGYARLVLDPKAIVVKMLCDQIREDEFIMRAEGKTDDEIEEAIKPKVERLRTFMNIKIQEEG